MIILCSGFSGAYLITAGVWPLIAGGQHASRIWLQPAPNAAVAGTRGDAALVVWIVLAVLGILFQFRGGRRQVEIANQPA